ncbi:MAG TPA: hypothetical protein VF555_02475 [Variovorax sp.]
MKKFSFFFLSALLAALAPMHATAQTTQPSLPPAQSRLPGLYVQVLDGLVKISNPAGSSNLSAGQFGFMPSPNVPPVVVPKDPGLPFTMPATFSRQSPVSGSSSAPKPNAVDCIVR